MKLKKFTPISKDILKQGEQYPFNIYKEIEEKVFLVLLKKDDLFIKSKECFLVDENISTLYIKSEDKKLYLSYIQNHINIILDDPSVNLDTKASFINQIASATMNELFESEVTSENIVQVDSLIDNSVHLILKDNKAMYSMLKLLHMIIIPILTVLMLPLMPLVLGYI